MLFRSPEKRSIANALTVHFKDGSSFPEIAIEYPVGHKRRRDEGMPLLIDKFRRNLARVFTDAHQKKIDVLFTDYERFQKTPVTEVMGLLSDSAGIRG